jgi:hypothetical protein
MNTSATLAPRLQRLEDAMQSLAQDLAVKPQTNFASPAYKKLSQQDKLLVLNQEILTLAKAAGVSLPNR